MTGILSDSVSIHSLPCTITGSGFSNSGLTLMQAVFTFSNGVTDRSSGFTVKHFSYLDVITEIETSSALTLRHEVVCFDTGAR